MKHTFRFYILVILTLSPLVGYSQSDGNDFSYALKLYEQKFYDLAARQFVRYYTRFPQSAHVDEAKFYAGAALFHLKEYNKARVEFQSLALEYPKSPRAAEAWYKVGECYRFLKQPEEAAKAFEAVKTLYPKHNLAPKSLLQAAALRQQMGEAEQAEALLQAVIDRYADHPEKYPALLDMAALRLKQKDLDRAQKIIATLFQEELPDNVMARALFLRAQINAQKGQYGQALGDYTSIVEDYDDTPQHIPAALAAARIAFGMGSTKQALSFLSDVHPATGDTLTIRALHMLKGDIHFTGGHYSLAVKEYQSIGTGNDSLAATALIKELLAMDKQGTLTEGGVRLKRLAGLMHYLPRPLAHALMIWLSEKGYSSAALGFLNAIPQNQSDPAFEIQWKSRFLFQNKDWNALYGLLEGYPSFINKLKEPDEILYFYGQALFHLEKYTDSRDVLDALLRRYPAGRYTEKATELRNNIDAFYLLDSPKAIRALARLNYAFIEGDKQDALFKLGRIYYAELKDYQTAAEIFERALKQTGQNNGDAWLWLGKSNNQLLKKAWLNGENGDDYRTRAEAAFIEAVKNSARCQNPDEASWLLVKTRLQSDSITTGKVKSYMQGLLKKFPQSAYTEEWLANMAYRLAFDSAYAADARNAYKQLITQYKESEQYSLYLYNYARLIQEEQPDVALSLYKTIALDHGTSYWADKALLEVARYYDRKAMHAEALTLYNRYLQHYPYATSVDEVKSAMAADYLKTGQAAKAIRQLDGVIRLPILSDAVLAGLVYAKDNTLDDLIVLARAYDQSNDFPRAVAHYNAFLRLAPNHPRSSEVSFALAALYEKSGQKQIAIDLYKKIESGTEPWAAQAGLKAAHIYFEQMDYKKAAALYGKWVRGAQKDNAGAYSNYIVSLIRSGQITSAEQQIKIFRKQFNRQEDNNARFILELGQYYRKNKNFKSALKYFERVIDDYDASPYVDDATYRKALVYITLNKHDDALEILSAFPQKYPNSDQLAAVYNTLGTIYYRGEAYDKSIAAFKKALNYPAEERLKKQTMSNLIKTYTMTGFWDAAQSLAREYVQTWPQAGDRIDKDIIIAQAFINLNKYQNAVDYLKRIKIRADSEKEPEIQYYIGEALLKAGRYEEAIAEFVKIPLLSKKTKLQWEASALYYSGQAYEKLGRIDDAVRMYREIINRPGIDLILKREAEKRIGQITGKG